MKTCKKFLLFALACVIVFCGSPQAFADIYAFSSKTTEVLDSFASVYGWDSESIQDAEWLGKGAEGRLYQRAAGYQKEYYEDLLESNKEYCLENGIIRVVSSGGAGGFRIAAIARAEVDAPDNMEVPPGSNQTKYNEWFYGSQKQAPWCAIFVSWCANECGLIDSGLFNKSAGVSNIYDYHTQVNGFASYPWSQIKQLNGGSYSPVPGDLYFFAGMGMPIGEHIGIVTAVFDDGIEVTHGNSTQERVIATKISPSGFMNYGTVVHVEYPSDADAIFYFLTECVGMPVSSACGVIANIEHESGFNPNAIGDYGTSYGICQWHDSRWANLQSFCEANGYDWESLDGQLYYLLYEITEGGEAWTGIYSILMSQPETSDGAYTAAYEWCVKFERCADSETMGHYRASTATDKYWPDYSTRTSTRRESTNPRLGN